MCFYSVLCFICFTFIVIWIESVQLNPQMVMFFMHQLEHTTQTIQTSKQRYWSAKLPIGKDTFCSLVVVCIQMIHFSFFLLGRDTKWFQDRSCRDLLLIQTGEGESLQLDRATFDPPYAFSLFSGQFFSVFIINWSFISELSLLSELYVNYPGDNVWAKWRFGETKLLTVLDN